MFRLLICACCRISFLQKIKTIPNTTKTAIEIAIKNTTNDINKLITKHLEEEFQKLNSPNILEIEMIHGAVAWLSDPKHPNYEAAARAIEKVYNGQKPDYTREGGSIPITSAIEDATGMNVLLLPIGACDDMAHSQNEKYNISNLVNGIKVRINVFGAALILRPSKYFAITYYRVSRTIFVLVLLHYFQVLGLYLHELGKIKGPKPSACRCVPLTEEELMVPGAFLKGFRCKCEM